MSEVSEALNCRLRNRTAKARRDLAHTDIMRWFPYLLLVLLCAGNFEASAADPLRGRQLYNTAPQQGLLACVDCHGEQPQEQNFGNIWAGRHATFLIERAISINTGGMGYFRSFYDQQAVADIAAWLGTTPITLNFAETKTGSTSAGLGVTLSSSTKAAITGLRWQVDGGFTVNAGTCGSTVERFSACTLTVAFAPREAGLRSGILHIAHDGSPSPVRIALSGTAQARAAAVASFGPPALTFGRTSPPYAATLRNDSAVALALQEVRVNGTGFRWAGGSCTPGLTLPANASCSVLLAFAPERTGASTGLASVAHDGQGGLSTIELRGDAGSAMPRLVSRTTALDLGTIGAGEIATSSWVTFVNQGPGASVWAPPASDDPVFSVAASDCAAGTTMASGTRCRVKVDFRPVRAGRFTSTLRWTSSAAITPELPLSGVATGAASAAPQVPLAGKGSGPASTPWAVDQVALAMGGGLSDPRVVRSLTVRNLGDQALDFGRMVVTGDAAGEFSLAGDCLTGRPILGRQACQIEVSRTARGAEDTTVATLLVQAGAPALQAMVLLDASRTEGALATPAGWAPARGASAAVALDVRAEGLALGAPLDWGGLQVGEVAAPRSVTLLNQGGLASAPLTWRLDGPGGADWSVTTPTTASACAAGQVLAAGAQCTLLLSFHPAGPGQRQGWLFLPGGDGLPALQLKGTGFVPAAGRVVAQPAAVTFQAIPGAAPPSQRVVISNVGAAAARVSSLGVVGAGFELVPSTAAACPAVPFDLLPGLSCTLGVTWAGTAAGAAGADLLVALEDGAGELRVPLAVSEDPLLKTNNGGSGGAVHGLWWLGLALAAGLLRGAPSRLRVKPTAAGAPGEVGESTHVC